MSSIVLFTFILPFLGLCCQYPTGLGTGTGEYDYSSLDQSINSRSLLGFNGDTRDLQEPTIFNRDVAWFQIMRYNAEVQPYLPAALEFFGRLDVSENRRFCSDSNETYLQQHQDITKFYSGYFWNSFVYPLSTAASAQFLSDANLNPDICNDINFDCDDISTPWGLAFTAINEIFNRSYYDGFNADGSYNRDVNRIPYQDYRNNPYVPKNSPWVLKKDTRWQPLLETDGVGFLYNQEHVVPHVGFTGTTFFLDDDYYCLLSSSDPDYDYDNEVDLLLERMRNLNDTQKMLIEVFDDKLASLNNLRNQYRNALNLRDPENLLLDTIGVLTFFITLHEASVVVWRQKVLFDLIRPTTIIQNELRDEYITTYGGQDIFGNGLGTLTFKGNDFEAYLRTMPHSEYPSGSACICEAVSVALKRYYELVGTSFEVDLVDQGGVLQFIFEALSSEIEPLTTPANEVRVTFSSWEEVSQACGQSRLDGGMHFTAAVPAGQNLCRDIGNKVFEGVNALVTGTQPDYVVDINDRTILQDRCGDYTHDNQDEDEDEDEEEDEEEDEHDDRD